MDAVVMDAVVIMIHDAVVIHDVNDNYRVKFYNQ